MIFDITITLDTSSVSVTATDDIDIVITLDAEQIPPASICSQIDDCLSIPEAEGSYVLTITDGVKSWSEYSPTGQVVIEKTKAEFLALVGSFQFPATYKITDVFEGLYVQTLSDSTFSQTAYLFAYLPNYIPDTDYKGQYVSGLGAIADGEIYTWGEWNYKNESGGALTPDIPSANVFDTANRFTQLSKSTANYYELSNFKADIINSVDITVITNLKNNNTINYWQLYNFVDAETAAAAMAQMNLNNAYSPKNGNNNFVALINNRVEIEANVLGIYSNYGAYLPNSFIKNCWLKDCGTNEEVYISVNNLRDSGVIENCVGAFRIKQAEITNGGARIKNLTALDGGYIDIINVLLRWNSYIEDINFSGTDGNLQFYDCEFHRDIWMTNWDVQISDGSTYTVGNTFLNDGVIIDTITITEGGLFNIGFGENFSVLNTTNPSYEAVSISSQIQPLLIIDGFTQPLRNEVIEAASGSFTFSYDFSINPLSIGNSLLFNLIPQYARVTKIIVEKTNITGIDVEVGLETDDEAIINSPVALLPLTWEGVSLPATADRSLKLKATGGGITAGLLTIKCEFIIWATL